MKQTPKQKEGLRKLSFIFATENKEVLEYLELSKSELSQLTTMYKRGYVDNYDLDIIDRVTSLMVTTIEGLTWIDKLIETNSSNYDRRMSIAAEKHAEYINNIDVIYQEVLPEKQSSEKPDLSEFSLPEKIITPEEVQVKTEELRSINNNQQAEEVLSAQEQASIEMETTNRFQEAFNNAKTKVNNATATAKATAEAKAKRTKEIFTELSKKRDKKGFQEWWDSLSYSERAAFISSLNTLFTIPLVWKAGWMWKITILSIVGVGSFFTSKELMKLQDKIRQQQKQQQYQAVNNPDINPNPVASPA